MGQGSRVVTTGAGLISELVNLVASWGRWWFNASLGLQVAFLASVLLIKNGLSLEIPNARDAYIPAQLALPAPSGYFSASLGNLVLARVLSVDTLREWMLLHGALVVLALFMAALLASRSLIAPRPVLLIVLVSSVAFATLFQTIGKYDPVTLIGACLFALARTCPAAALGAAVMVLGNPEQAILATLCLVILSLAPDFREWARRAWVGLAVTTIMWVPIQLWMLDGGVDSRLRSLDYFLGLSFGNFLRAPNIAVWSWLGVGWLIVLSLIWATSGRTRLALVVSILAVPVAATMVTADGARVYGLIALPALTVASIWFWNRFSESRRVLELGIGGFLILWILVPSTGGGWGTAGVYLATWVQTAIVSLTGGV